MNYHNKRGNSLTSVERAYQWKEEGRIHVSPHEAAEVLDADPYTLNICARVGSFALPIFSPVHT